MTTAAVNLIKNVLRSKSMVSLITDKLPEIKHPDSTGILIKTKDGFLYATKVIYDKDHGQLIIDTNTFRELSSANSKGGERIAYDKLHSPLFLRVERAWHKHRVKGWEWKNGADYYRIDSDGVFATGGSIITIAHKFPYTDEGRKRAQAFLAEIGQDDYIKYCELKTNRP